MSHVWTMVNEIKRAKILPKSQKPSGFKKADMLLPPTPWVAIPARCFSANSRKNRPRDFWLGDFAKKVTKFLVHACYDYLESYLDQIANELLLNTTAIFKKLTDFHEKIESVVMKPETPMNFKFVQNSFQPYKKIKNQ